MKNSLLFLAPVGAFFFFFRFTFALSHASLSLSLSHPTLLNQQRLKDLRLRDDARGADGKELVSLLCFGGELKREEEKRELASTPAWTKKKKARVVFLSFL